MKLKFLLAAFCFFSASLEYAHCGKFKVLEGEEKLKYAGNKYEKHTDSALDEYDPKLQHYMKEKKPFPDSEINSIFSKALKWGAKYLKELSVSEKEDIPEEFLSFVRTEFHRLKTGIAYEGEGGAALREIENEVSELQAQCIVRSLSVPETYKPAYLGQAKRLANLIKSLDKQYKQKAIISLFAIEELIDMIEEKNEDAIIRKLSNNIWKISYLYRTMEKISPGFFSCHLPPAK